MDGLYIFAFIGGAVATVNPCGFALLPAYLARRIEVDGGDDNLAAIMRAVAVGAVTTGGILFIFGLAGATLSLGATWLIRSVPWAGLVIGFVLLLAGVVVLSGHKLSIRLPMPGGRIKASSWAGDLLFGVGYGTVSLSCTLPLFLAITGTTITGSLTNSAFTFVSYAAGMGTVMMVLAVAAAMAGRGLESWIKKAGVYINRFSGGVLLLSGVYITLYWGLLLFWPKIRSASGLFVDGEVLSGLLRGWLAGSVGRNVVLGLAALIAVFLGWLIWSRLSKKPHADDPA